jgi:uncharacterized protein YdeI (YjbR/CyaY-like superfamily)
MSINDATKIYPTSQEEWRTWLEENHIEQDAVWVVMYKKASPFPTVTWSETVDVALCYGWIDSVRRPHDEFSSLQYYSKRKAKSTWSKINKDKVEILIEQGLMKEAGLKSIKIAKENGSWTFLDAVDALIVPEDLKAAFDELPGSEVYFESLSKSARKLMLYWILSAKRPETRAKRIAEIAENASRGEKPKSIR